MLYARYIFRSLCLTTLTLAVGLTLVLWLTQSLRLLELVVGGNANVLKLFGELLLLTVPKLLETILPLAAALAVIIVYGRLQNEREYAIFRASGLSNRMLARPALWLMVGLMVCLLGLSGWLTPFATARTDNLKTLIQSDVANLLLREGEFTDIGKKTTLYVSRREGVSGLQGLIIQQISGKDTAVTIIAERGQLDLSQAPPRIIVYNGQRQTQDPSSGRVQTLSFDRYSFPLQQDSRMGRSRPDADGLSLLALVLNPPQSADKRGLKLWRIEINGRILRILGILCLVPIALVGIMHGGFTRQRRARVISVAIAVLFVQALLMAGVNITGRGGVATMAVYIMLALITATAWHILIREELQR